MSTSTDGVISRKLQLKGYLRQKETAEVWLAETKLSEDRHIKPEEKQSYNVWRKDR